MSNRLHLNNENDHDTDAVKYEQYADATVQVRQNDQRERRDPDATIRVDPRDARNARDLDATVRAPARLSPELLKKAIAQSSVADAQPSAQSEPDAQQFVAQARKRKRSGKKLALQIGCAAVLALLLALVVSTLVNHSGEASAQQKSAQSKAQLDSRVQQAETLGVPASYLQAVLKQEQQMGNGQPLFGGVNPQTTGYYQHAKQQYDALAAQIPGIVAFATDQLQARAQQDMQDFQTALSNWNSRGIGNTHYFAGQFTQDQLALSSAQTVGDYNTISRNAQQSIDALTAMGNVYGQLNNFNATIGDMSKAHLDVTAIQAQYQNDVQTFANATTTADFQNLSAQLNVQYQQVVANSIQAFPYVGVTMLNALQQQISQLHTYGGNAASYQSRLSADQVAEQNVNTVYEAILFIKQVDNDISSMHGDLVKGEAHYLVAQFHQQVNAWAKANPYYDKYNGQTYALDDGYMHTGIGGALDSDLAGAVTTADYEAMVNEANNDLFDLRMFEADYTDHTPYNQVHATDTQMLKRYNLQGKQVLMVSLSEQVMRVYQNGKLLRSFYVTTGRTELPSPPGVWSVLDRRSPATFVSGEAQSSPYWFPPTPIKYAILYHYGGDFVHDAWWRQSFGPGTQFPHLDAGGNTSYNFDGSHGCINLTTADATWVYQHSGWNTAIVVY